MRSMLHVPFLVALSLGLLSCTPGTGTDTASSSSSSSSSIPSTEEEKILNALGQALAQNVLGAGLSDAELDFVQRGLADTILGQDALVDLNEYGPQIQGFMQARMGVAADADLDLTTAFLDEQAALEGAERTESGLIIQQMTTGDGPSPVAEDTVRVHYHGTLRDGTVFDSSVDRGEPATFPLGGVIPCWTEGLQLMNVGGTSQLVCPPDLAYGPGGRPGIPGNAALVFEVELLEIMEN